MIGIIINDNRPSSAPYNRLLTEEHVVRDFAHCAICAGHIEVLPITGRNRFGSIRFVHFLVRRGSACVFRTRRGLVRLGSLSFRVRFQPVPESYASVRFSSVRPVRFGFLLVPATSSSREPDFKDPSSEIR